MSEIVLITISGKDHPGLTSAFARVLSKSGALLLDIGQAVIHDALALGMMVLVPKADLVALQQAIEQTAIQLGVAARLTEISEDHYHHWIDKQHKQRFIVTLLAEQVRAENLA